MYNNTLRLPFSRGPVEVTALGDVSFAIVYDTCLVSPFAQPQPEYSLVDVSGTRQRYTTNGIALLTAAVNGHSDPVEVLAGWHLLAALLISPQGMTLQDVSDCHWESDCRLVFDPTDARRIGLPHGSRIIFATMHVGRLDFRARQSNPGSYRYGVDPLARRGG